MDFKLQFNMDNASFKYSPEYQTAKILQTIKERVSNGMVYGKIIDENGNTIGQWEILIDTTNVYKW